MPGENYLLLFVHQIASGSTALPLRAVWFVNLSVLTQQQAVSDDDFIMIWDNCIQEQNTDPLSYKVWPYQSDPYCYAEINSWHYTAQYVEHGTQEGGEVLSESGNVVNDHDLVTAVVSCWELYMDNPEEWNWRSIYSFKEIYRIQNIFKETFKVIQSILSLFLKFWHKVQSDLFIEKISNV